MSYVGDLVHSVVATDWSKRRGWSALRRGLVVLAALLFFGGLYGKEIGALASVAALYVGLQDRAANPPGYTAKLMGLQSVVLAAAIFLSGISPFTWLSAIMLVAFATMSGLTARHDKAISRMFCDIIAVDAFLGLQSITVDYAKDAALAVLIASLVQTGLTIVSARFNTDLPERRPVAVALQAVAVHLSDAQSRNLTGTGEAATTALGNADASVARSDLSHHRRRALRKLLGDAERLREEASALRARRAFDTAVIEDDDVEDAVALAVTTLAAAARALTVVQKPGIPSPRLTAALAELDACQESADEIISREGARGSATAIARNAKRVARHVAQIFDAPGLRDRKTGRSITATIEHDLFQPARHDVMAGARLGLAAALGLGIAAIFHIPHGSWVAASATALLRPDHRAVTTDTVARSVGTGLGAIAVIPLVAMTDHLPGATILLVFLLAVATFAITAANEGLYIVMITIQTVFTRALVGEDPVAVAASRVVDVLIGCGIAVVLLYAVPLRHGRHLKREIADYADATADWLTAVAKLSKGGKGKGRKSMHRRMTQARAGAQHGLDVRKVEPLGPGLPPWWGQNLFTLIHDTERASVAAETTLGHGAEGSPAAKRMAAAAAGNLRITSAAMRASRANPFDAEGAAVVELPQSAATNDVELLLALAVRESAAAAEMAVQYATRRDPADPQPTT